MKLEVGRINSNSSTIAIATTAEAECDHMAIGPWLRALDFYGAKEVLAWEDHSNLVDYVKRFEARPAVQKGLVTPARD